MINYNKYPINTPSSSEYNDLVKVCIEQLGRQGFVSLKNFLKPHRVNSLVSSILSLERQGIGFYSKETHNVFLEGNDSVSIGGQEKNSLHLHPRHVQLKSSKLLINAKDLAPCAAGLNELFHSAIFLKFICDVLQIMELYPSTDEYGKYYANIFHEGDGLNFHFDRSEFSISLILQPADEGGKFQFVPSSRDVIEGWQEMPLNIKDLQCALNATSPATKSMIVQEPELTAGDLYLFHGQNSLHRVSEVTRGKRVNIILTFNREKEAILNNYTLKKFFGVTRP